MYKILYIIFLFFLLNSFVIKDNNNYKVSKKEQNIAKKLILNYSNFDKFNIDEIQNKNTKTEQIEEGDVPYSRTIVAFFAFPLFIAGLFGLHRFALGYKKIGIIQALLMFPGCFFLIPTILNFVWVTIDWIRILKGKLIFKDGTKTKWGK